MKKEIFWFVIFIFSILYSVNLSHAQWQPDVKLTSISNYTYDLPNNGWQIAAQGNIIHAVWYDNRDGNYEIYYKRSTDTGTSWGADTRLTNALSNSQYPSIAASGLSVHVVWCDLRDGDWALYYKRSTDGGLTWSTDMRLTSQPSNAFNPSLSVAGNVMHLAWMDSRDGNYEIYYKHSTDNGFTWSADTRMTNTSTTSSNPSIAISGQTVHLVWYDTPGQQQKIFYKHSTDGGTIWGSDTLISNPNQGGANFQNISVSGENVHIVWVTSPNNINQIYYRHSSNAGNSWETITRLTYDSTYA